MRVQSQPQPRMVHDTERQPRIMHDEDKFTITRHKISTTTVSFPGSTEPITSTKETTETIDIPKSLVEWNPFFHGLRHAIAEDQGKRKHMENSTNIADHSQGQATP